MNKDLLRLRKLNLRKKQIETGQLKYSTPPYGFKFDFSSESFFQIEDEAHIVRLMFDLVLKGLNVSQITILINEKGIRSRRGKEWSHTTIHRILVNPFYMGSQRVSYIDAETNVRVFANIKNCSIVPIVSEDEFNRVQTTFKSTRYPQERDRSDNLLMGLLYCECGSKILCTSVTRRTKQNKESRFNVYHCSNDYRDSLKKRCFSRKKDDIEDSIIDCVISQDVGDLLMPAVRQAESIAYQTQSQFNMVQNEIDELKGNIDELSRKMVETKSLPEAGSLMVEIEKNKKLVKIKLKEYKVAQTNLEAAQDELVCLNNFKNIDRLDQFFGSASSKEKQTFLRSIIGRITYRNTNQTGEIEFKNGLKDYFKTL